MSVFNKAGIYLVGEDFDETKTELKKVIRTLGGTASATFTKNVQYVIASKKDDDYAKYLDLGYTIYNEAWLKNAESKGELSDLAKFRYAKPKATKVDAASASTSSPTNASPSSTPALRASKRIASVAAASATVSNQASQPAAKKSKGAKKANDTADQDDDKKNDVDDDKKDDAQPAPSNTVVVLKNSASAPVDAISFPCFSHYQLSNYHVVVEKGVTWDAMLNQANVVANNNKFYVLQLLQHDSNAQQCVAWFRWGRVGAIGSESVVRGSLEQCRTQFLSKYNSKTGNVFNQPFTPKSGKYILIERDFTNDDDKKTDDKTKEDKDSSVPEVKKSFPPSTLHPEVSSLIHLICDVQNMAKQMIEIGFDANKMPLGKLSKTTVKLGYETLSGISDLLTKYKNNYFDLKKNKKDNEELIRLTNLFYAYIPHCVGRQRLPIIDNLDMLKKKIEMVESLAEIESVSKILEDTTDYSINPTDKQYQDLRCKIEHVGLDSEIGKMVATYVKNTHAQTHSYYDLELENVYAIERENESQRFLDAGFHKDSNRQLLWHGSRLTNFVGILSQGLRIAPPEAPVTGYMFGKGVYFADMVSKSANYTGASVYGNQTGLLLLCEVALGKHNELKQSDYYANRLPPGTLSTKGLGGTAPKDSEAIYIEDSIKVPLGKPGETKLKDLSLLYNEYIVYDVSQIRMKYLVKLKFVKPGKTSK